MTKKQRLQKDIKTCQDAIKYLRMYWGSCEDEPGLSPLDCGSCRSRVAIDLLKDSIKYMRGDLKML